MRLPGGIRDEEGLWSFLREGRSAMGQISSERWDVDLLRHPSRAEPGRSVTFRAGVLHAVDEFDASFFGISPREARQMDPQQRLVLELAWEALENGGQRHSALAGTDCGVYIGSSGADALLRAADDLSAVEPHTMTGVGNCIIANRLSYILDLRGPSLTLDTACSASLVALHHACQAIRHGEVSAALVGGVNMLLHPLPFVGFSRASMLSEGAQCRSFDARGDGYGRSEGGVVLFLKSLEQALLDGDPVQAVIIGSGVNTDGRNEGMTLPRQETQALLVQRTMGEAGVDPGRYVYLEAHGTGTAAGDPVETRALGEAIGKRRAPGNPLPIGSVKTNLGHLEGASGLVGVAKSIAVLRRRVIPPSLFPEIPNPELKLDELNLDVIREMTPFPPSGEAALVGVNSFGFGGANAHILLEEYRVGAPSLVSVPSLPPLLFSARSEAALRELAGAYAARLDGVTWEEFYRVAYNAAFRRDPLEVGAALHAGSVESAVSGLAALASGESRAGVVVEPHLGADLPVAFVYSGNGCQWAGMGQRLMAQEPLFLEAIREVDVHLARHGALSVEAELARSPGANRFHLTEVAQPSLFAMQVGITRLLSQRGLDPHAVMGHSVGEIAAAWAAGCLSLDQAVKVVVERSMAQAQTVGLGRMAALGLSAEEAWEAIRAAGVEGRIEVAGINSPRDVTVSGDELALTTLGERVLGEGAYFRLLDLNYAFHSRHMDGARGLIESSLVGLRGLDSQIPFVSTVSGQEMAGSQLTAGYWWENIRKPVLFQSAVEHLVRRGVRIFLEVGPHAILQRYLSASLRGGEVRSQPLPTLLRGEDEEEALSRSLWRCRLMGGRVRMNGYFPEAVPYLPLPNYPWQRERYWPEPTSEASGRLAQGPVHPLLGRRLTQHRWGWESHLDLRVERWLADHRVGQAVLVPASGFVEMALAASAQWRPMAQVHEVEGLEIRLPISLSADRAQTVRFELDDADGTFTIRSRERLRDEPWRVNAVGRVLPEPGNPVRGETTPHLRGEIRELEGRSPVADARSHREQVANLGLDYGPAFQGLQRVWRSGEGEVVAQVEPPAEPGSFFLHPGLLDSCLQSVLHALGAPTEGGSREALIPVRMGRFTLRSGSALPRWCRTRVLRQSRRSVLVDFDLFDGEGEWVGRVSQCRLITSPFARSREAPPSLWRWTTEARPHPTDSSPSAPGLTRWVEALREGIPQGGEAQRRRLLRHDELAPLLDALVGMVVREATVVREEESAGEGPESLKGLAPHPLTLWCRQILEEDRSQGYGPIGGSEANVGEGLPSASQLWTGLLREYPECLPELSLLGRVARDLPLVLEGKMSADELGDLLDEEGVWDRCLDAAPLAGDLHDAVRAAFAALVGQWPTGRRPRILEVGGGFLVSVLREWAPAEGAELVLVPQHRRKEEVFAPESDGRVEISVVPAGARGELPQELEDGTPFDLILVTDGLNHQLDPTATLRDLGRILRPTGVFLSMERALDRWYALTRGLRRHWWRPGLSARPVARSTQGWLRVLAAAGMREATIVHELGEPYLNSGGFLLLAEGGAWATHPSPEVCSPQCWIVLATPREESTGHDLPLAGLGSSLVESLRQAGHRAVLLEEGTAFRRVAEEHYLYDPTDPDGLPELLATLRREVGEWHHLVHTLGISPSMSEPTRNADPLRSPVLRILSTIHWAQATLAPDAAKGPASALPQFWLVTRGAPWFGGDRPTVPAESALWGLGRVLMNEHPEFRTTLIDLQGDEQASAWVPLLLREFLDPDGEEEVILSPDGTRRVTRLRETALVPPHRLEPERARLTLTRPGQLSNLEWTTNPQREVGEGEVELETRAIGLNFRDVMFTLGLLTDEAMEGGFAGPHLGLEVSGVIRRVGAGVSHLREGDEVVAFTSAGFAGQVVVPATAVAKKPEDWSFEAAATVPTAFFTAWYALHHVGRLRPGERVLIHGGAGGVGMAAIQIAHYLGAEVLATAGTPEKRQVLRLFGVEHVMDSRTLAFADRIMCVTGGEGVDVVLNSLAGEALLRSLRVLRPFGRFLELGKRDFYENTRVGLRPLKDNVSYAAIDADQLMSHRPQLGQSVLSEVMGLLEEGVLRPLPFRSFPAGDVVQAFRYMQQSRQIGKVVVQAPTGPVEWPGRLPSASELRFRSDGTYLVVGGTSGLGLRTARWYAERGAGNLLLVSRRGPATPGLDEATEELEALGVRVHVRACDIEDGEAVRALVAECGAGLPPLRGVVHAAMVLDDGLIRNLTPSMVMGPMGPKVRGAWNLHVHTRELPLDHFVLFSSATTSIGNPGQAAYVAANVYLESLAACRRQEGLPATSISLGAIRDVGYLSRNQGVRDVLEARTGGDGLLAETALEALAKALLSNQSGLAVSDFDWNVLDRFLSGAGSRRFSRIRRSSEGDSTAGLIGAGLRSHLQELPVEEGREFLADVVRAQVAEVLRLSSEAVPLDRNLQDLGMDSLTGAELMVGLEKRLGVPLPDAGMIGQRSILQLADRMSGLLGRSHGAEDGLDLDAPFGQAVASMERAFGGHGVELASDEVTKILKVLLEDDGVSAASQ